MKQMDFEIDREQPFLSYFWDHREIRCLPLQTVERLRLSEEPRAQYGYGQWLARTRIDEESLKVATASFRFAANNGVADALQMLSHLYAMGDAYDEAKGQLLFDPLMAHVLNATAVKRGSELAKLRRNFDLFHGRLHLPSDPEAAILEAEGEADRPEASLLWREQLGWFYEAVGRSDEAARAYEACIEGGLRYPIFDLAFLFLERGEIARYEELMRRGIALEVPGCMALGVEKEAEWNSLSAEEQVTLHRQLKGRLEQGIALGNTYCIWVMAYSLIFGKLGFESNPAEGLRVAQIGVRYHDSGCCSLILQLMSDSELVAKLPEELQLSDQEQLLLLLRGLRYGDKGLLEQVVEHHEAYAKMGYGDEVADVWLPMWHELREAEDQMDEEDAQESPSEAALPKTEIAPTVLIIHPSGFVDFVEADLNPMSLREMGELIGAEGVEAVHYSEPLYRITKACGFERQVVMYLDRAAAMKELEDNPVATMLYGRECELRGSVIIALENRRFDTYSFDTEEDLESLYEAIFDLSGGLIRRDTGEEDGRYDPWA